jgi:predicted ArsR family transcriptional regulator
MVDVERVPAEMRWRLATRMLTYLPFAYHHMFRDPVGEEYVSFEKRIFQDLARESRAIAAAFQLPVRNAVDLSQTLESVASVMYGPGMGWILREHSEDSVVIRVRECPNVDLAREFGFDMKNACNACRSYTTTLLESLNPEYSLSFSGEIDPGGYLCEMTLSRKS